MEQFALSPFEVENYGPCVVEDFVPYSDARALVSAGRSFRELEIIADVRYSFEDTLKLSNVDILRRVVGGYLRLGHWDGNGHLFDSDGWEGAHQPFEYQGRIYYSDGAPNAKLYCNGEVLIDHWGDVEELGNPWVTDERVWFEARSKHFPAPEGWRIHYADLDGGNITYFCLGANPCVYKDMLYYGVWNGKTFDFARRNVKKDDLFTASMERYGEYLRSVYNKMKKYVKSSDTVVEVCTRHDRGRLGEEILPHESYIMIDRNHTRPGLDLDAITNSLPICDVLLSTAILHHTRPEDIKKLFTNLARDTGRFILLSGPNAAVMPELFGDHLYHIDADHLCKIGEDAGWSCIEASPCGLSEPLCEILMVFERRK